METGTLTGFRARGEDDGRQEKSRENRQSRRGYRDRVTGARDGAGGVGMRDGAEVSGVRDGGGAPGEHDETVGPGGRDGVEVLGVRGETVGPDGREEAVRASEAGEADRAGGAEQVGEVEAGEAGRVEHTGETDQAGEFVAADRADGTDRDGHAGRTGRAEQAVRACGADQVDEGGVPGVSDRGAQAGEAERTEQAEPRIGEIGRVDGAGVPGASDRAAQAGEAERTGPRIGEIGRVDGAGEPAGLDRAGGAGAAGRAGAVGHIGGARDDRVGPPLLGAERETLRAFLDYHRAALAMKCAGLTDEELRRRSMPPSTLSLLGLVRHMAEVERAWFRRVFEDHDAPMVWSKEIDFQAAYDASASTRAEAFGAWEAEVATSRRIEREAESLELTGRQPRWNEDVSLRMVMIHVLLEYGRHNGHADFLREGIDGTVGA